MATLSDSEADLLARCRSGDEEAFRQLVERYDERVYRITYALLAHPADAQEVEQETFLKAWRGIASFRGDAALGTWLTRLALNAAHDHLRRQRTRAAAHQALWLESCPRSDEALQRVEDRDQLRRALQRLSLPLRQTIA